MSDMGICEYCKYKDEAAEPCWTCCVEKGNFEIDMSEHDANVRAEAIDECLSVVEWDGYTLDIKRRIEQLKEQKNE